MRQCWPARSAFCAILSRGRMSLARPVTIERQWERLRGRSARSSRSCHASNLAVARSGRKEAGDHVSGSHVSARAAEVHVVGHTLTKMLFKGKVQSRSSAPQARTGPPGESEIQRLNPQRESAIRRVTGWDMLAPGSLNLAVDDSVVEALGNLEPALKELASAISCPQGYEAVPRIRRGCWYCPALAKSGGLEERALVRRAIAPVRGVVELFAPESLTDKFNLRSNDVVAVEVRAVCRVDAPGPDQRLYPTAASPVSGPPRLKRGC